MFGKEKSLLEQENEDFKNSPASDMFEDYKPKSSGSQPQYQSDYNGNAGSDYRQTPPAYQQNDYRQTPPPAYQQNNMGSAPAGFVQGSPKSKLGFQLAGGELVLWEGKSVGNNISQPDKVAETVSNVTSVVSTLVSKIFGIIWLAFSVMWTLAAAKGSLIMAAFGVPFIGVGIYMIFGNNKGRKRRSFNGGPIIPMDEAYAITTMRVISRNGGRMRSDILRAIFDITYKLEDDGVGSVVYSRGEKQVGGNLNLTSDNTGVIDDIENPQLVYQILCDAVNKANL